MIKGLLDRFVSPVQQSYRSGNLFGGGTQLEKLLGEDVRRQAQKQAITQLGMGLLSQGPSRTPIRTSASLGQGLLGAQQAYQKSLGSQLQQAAAIKALGKPDYIKMKDEDGREILFDPVTKEKVDPFVSTPTAPLLTPDLPEVTEQDVPDIATAAGGDVYGFGKSVIGAIPRALGFEAFKETAEAKAQLNSMNTETQIGLTKALGSRYTKAVKDVVEKNLPQTTDSDVVAKAKTEALINKIEREKSLLQSELNATTSAKKQKELRQSIRELNAVKAPYEIMLQKTRRLETESIDSRGSARGAQRRLESRSRNASILSPEGRAAYEMYK